PQPPRDIPAGGAGSPSGISDPSAQVDELDLERERLRARSGVPEHDATRPGARLRERDAALDVAQVRVLLVEDRHARRAGIELARRSVRSTRVRVEVEQQIA